MTASGIASANMMWFLIGPLDSTEATRYVPIHTLPFVVGRRQGLGMVLACNTVSSVHADISQSDGSLVLRDLDSTNGTYVNGRRVTKPVALGEDDLVQFANVVFRVRKQAAHGNLHTIQEDFCDQAMAMIQFDRLMAERAATPFFQAIVSIQNRQVVSYEILGRSRLFGVETPKEMFSIAAQLNMEVELSVMLRWEGVASGQALPGLPHLFMNTHPRELGDARLLDSLRKLRGAYPTQPLTLEIHEAAVADTATMSSLRAALKEMNIGLAYDDFGAGQSRLEQLPCVPPDCLKFDMSLIRDIDSATPQRQAVLASLVQMARGLGITTLAEGVETAAESDTCQQMGFELGQGFFYGVPAPAPALSRSVRPRPRTG